MQNKKKVLSKLSNKQYKLVRIEKDIVDNFKKIADDNNITYAGRIINNVLLEWLDLNASIKEVNDDK
jgi:hypothetical protein